MAGNIKGITIEFRGDTTQLDKALRSIDKETSGIDKELKQVNNGLKFNPTSATLWSQKYDLLKNKISETKTRLDTLKQAQKKMDASGVDKNSAEYRSLQREIVTTESKLKNFNKQLRQIGSPKLAALGAQLKQIGAKMTAIGRGFSTYITAPLAGVAAASLKAGSSFDTAMSQVAATMGVTVDEIQELRDFAKEMGSTTSFSATQAAEGLNYMALAGYDAKTSMEMLPTVLNLAAAGTMELGAASDMVTDAQTALGLSTEETTDLIDKMAQTSSKSNTSVSQMGEAILKIGGNAKNLAGGTRELSQVLGLLADNGIKGSEAGTHLRNIMLALNPTTDKAADAWNELGLSAYDAEGNLKPLEETFGELSEAVSGMSSEQRTKLLSAMFNKTDLSSVNALLDTSAERWKELGSSIDDASGAAGKMADTQLDNMQGSLTLLKSAVEGAGIAISDVLAPYVRKLADFVSGLVSGFNSLNPGIQKMIVLIGAVAAAIGPVLLIIGMISTGIGTILPLLAGISAPMVAIAAGAALLGAALVTAYTNSKPFREAINEIAVELVSTFKPVLDAVIDNLKTLIREFILTINVVGNQFTPIIKALIPLFKIVAKLMAGQLKRGFDLVIGVIRVAMAIVRSLATIFSTAFRVIVSIVTGAVSKIKNAFSRVKDALVKPFETAKTIIKGIIDAIKGFFNFSVKTPKIPLPRFAIYPPGWKLDDLLKGSIPKLKIDWYKKGGIFDNPTLYAAGIGEAGPEAVVPLSGRQMQPFAKAIAENMDGFDYAKLSEAIVAALMSVNADIVLNVDGKKVADVTAPYMNSAINTLQRRQNRKIGIVGV